jgi:hypothetical protein
MVDGVQYPSRTDSTGTVPNRHDLMIGSCFVLYITTNTETQYLLLNVLVRSKHYLHTYVLEGKQI